MQSWSERMTRTIGATAAVLAAAAAGVAPAADRVGIERLAAELAARLEGMLGERAFADLPEGLREAELQALQITLAIYEAGLLKTDKATPGPGRRFHSAAVQFSASELAGVMSARGATGSRRIKRTAAEADDDGAVAIASLAQLRRAAEEALLMELDLALGAQRLPDRFLSLFLDARPDSAAWFDAFSLYVAWLLRSDGGLQAGIAAAALPALAALGLTMPELLDRIYRNAKAIALRLESRLAEADRAPPEPGEAANTEVRTYLARLPAELAQRHGVPLAALERSAAALRAAGGDFGQLAERLDRQAVRLRGVFGELSLRQGPAGADRVAAQAALALLTAGKLDEAVTALSGWPGSAAREMAVGACCALGAEWRKAKDHLNRAIELVEPARPQQACEAALNLARVLAEGDDPDAHRVAMELYGAMLPAARTSLDTTRYAEVCIDAAQTVLLIKARPVQLKMLSALVEQLGKIAPDEQRKLTPLHHARLLGARGDALLALTSHGGDRLAEAAAVFKAALQQATVAQDVRLVSELHVRLAEIALQQAQATTNDAAQTLRRVALQSLQAAQGVRLRTRDPIWWAEVKVRFAEISLVIGTADRDAGVLRTGMLSAKAALRLLPCELLAERAARALTVIGDTCAALAKIEPPRKWREHARGAYEEALVVTDPTAKADAWAELQISIAGQLLPESGEADADRLELAIGCYRAAVSALPPKTARLGRAQRLLADALTASGKRRLDLSRLEEAVGVYRAGLALLAPKHAPVQWCQSWVGLCDAERELARLQQDATRLKPLLVELERAMTQAGKTPPHWMTKALSKAQSETSEAVRKLASHSSAPVLSEPVGMLVKLLHRA